MNDFKHDERRFDSLMISLIGGSIMVLAAVVAFSVYGIGHLLGAW